MKTKITSLILIALCMTCFAQNQEQHIYLAGWEAQFNGDEQCQKFLETQVIDKKTAETVWSSIHLVFENGALVKAYDKEEDSISERELDDTEIGLEFQFLEPNKIFRFVQVSKSESYLGGEIPEEFSIPKFEFNAPFQYLGKLSKSEEAFNWLPFDLHLVAPIYLSFDKLFVDYSDPLNPKVLNAEDLVDASDEYEEIKSDSEIVYEKVCITTKRSYDFDSFAFSGVPSYIQYPDIPTCPKSKRTMKFLCQLTDAISVKTKRSNVIPEDEWSAQYYERMNFWGDGDLYIFFDPESKIACFFIQNT